MPLNVSVVDDFNRADAFNAGAAWVQSPWDFSDPLKISDHQCAAEYYCVNSYHPTPVDVGDGNIEVAYTVAALPIATGAMQIGLLSRLTAESGYRAEFVVDTGAITLNRVDSGTPTALDTDTTSFSPGDLFILRLIYGGHLKVIRDRGGSETEILTADDTDYTDGFYAVIGAYDPGGARTWRADDFAVGTYNPDAITFTARLSGGSSNTDPALSLGGAESSTVADGATVLSTETNATRIAGRTRYRCLYYHNEDDTRSADVIAWVSASSLPSGVAVAIGAAVEGAGSAAGAIVNDTTPPASVVFTTPTTSGAAISLGTVDPGESTGVWVREVLGADEVDVDTGAHVQPSATLRFRATLT